MLTDDRRTRGLRLGVDTFFDEMPRVNQLSTDLVIFADSFDSLEQASERAHDVVHGLRGGRRIAKGMT
jgi:hypothetical protein